MKTLKSRFQKGFVTIKVDANDDLWYLKNVVEPGDFVKAMTPRSVFIEREGKRIKVEKKPMMLKIQVEKVEFKKYGDQLRLMGKIVEGPERVQLGSYHTIEARIGTVLTIHKEEWKKHHKERLKKAQTKVPDVLIVVVNSDRATFGLLRKSGVEIVLELTNPHPIDEEERLREFHEKIATEIGKYPKETEKMILAGPGFTKEHVRDAIEKKYPETFKKLILDTTSSATISGINEIVKKGALKRVVKDTEIVKESELINEFFTHIKKEDGLSTYGLKEVEEADKIGAIEILLISEEKIREEKIDKLAREVEKKRGKVEIISTTHDLGEQFAKMGGLGAILRFKIS